ncbi:hypothetical protein AGOR_G00248940 [Albula goreensis]|uniref:Uncharacterized protein n=1 Tax=Albula goreensis TaxID=1534307 RepID=A0A8T3CBC5_9TELE|nr:hypothetical protein AGOR_G00248940 [Albula goreensis]
MINNTILDLNPLTPHLNPEYILIPFLGFTLFGLLASLGAFIRRQRTDVLWYRLSPLDDFSFSEHEEESDEEEDLRVRRGSSIIYIKTL